MANKQSVAQKVAPAPASSPVRQALMKVAQNFSINLAPFPDEQAALAFKADAEQALACGLISAETHRSAQQLFRDGRRLKRAIEEHWSQVTRWLEDRKKDIRTIAAMDVEVVAPVTERLNTAILRYEEEDARRRRVQEERARQEQERQARERREADLAEMERQALAAEAASEDLSDRERAFVQRCHSSVGVNLTSERWLNDAARSCGFKQDGYGLALFKKPKIQYAIEAMKQARALREQAAAVAEKPIEIEQPRVEAQTAKVAGVRTHTSYTAECFDFDLFIDKFVAGEVDRLTFRTLAMPCVVAGNEMARALHENLDRIPGWRHIKKVTKAG